MVLPSHRHRVQSAARHQGSQEHFSDHELDPRKEEEQPWEQNFNLDIEEDRQMFEQEMMTNWEIDISDEEVPD